MTKYTILKLYVAKNPKISWKKQTIISKGVPGNRRYREKIAIEITAAIFNALFHNVVMEVEL